MSWQKTKKNKFKKFGAKIDSCPTELILGNKSMMKAIEKSLWWEARIRNVNKKDNRPCVWLRFELDPNLSVSETCCIVERFECDLDSSEFDSKSRDEYDRLCMNLDAFFKPLEDNPIQLEHLKEMVRNYIKNVWNKQGYYLDEDDSAVFRWMVSDYDLIITAALDSNLNIKDIDVYAEDEEFGNKVINKLTDIERFCIHQSYRTLPSFLDKLFSDGWFDEAVGESEVV